MTYPEAEAFLFALPRFADVGAAAYQPGLARMERLMDGMGSPHRAFPALHVAGTNGKGSTSSIAAALLTASGLKTGLHTSPHLWKLTERMRVDGVPAPDAWIADTVARYAPLMQQVQPSFFEATVALSFLHFAQSGVDVAVVEVGLGGRLDATNVLPARVALVTSIALDHTDLLGNTLGEIAREKAGIFKPAAAALTNADAPAALEVLESVARQQGVVLENVRQTVQVRERPGGLTLTTPLAAYTDLQLSLAGSHQQGNAALALRGVETLLERALPVGVVRQALAEVPRLTGLRARLQTLYRRPRVLADVCHNPAGLAAALEAARPASGGALHVLFGLMGDKDAPAMAALLAAHKATVHPVPLGGERAMNTDVLCRVLADAGVRVTAPQAPQQGLEAFLARAREDDVLLIAGSHGVVAGLKPELFAETRQIP